MHVFDQLLADRQAQSRPALLARVRGIGLGKLLENPCVELGRDARPLVAHPDPHPGAALLRAERDCSSLG